VEEERDQLKELFDLIRDQPDTEAHEIFRRLRTSSNPLHVFRDLRQANLLLPNPDPVSQVIGNPQVGAIDSEALRSSALKLRARPWTTVAGDGLVSALISSFFAWDGNYLTPFVESKCFIKAMNTGNVVSIEFCSPFLVNAICCISVSANPNLAWLARACNILYHYPPQLLEPSANLRSTVCKLSSLLPIVCYILNVSPQFFSTRVKKVFTITGEDLTRSFDAEARRHIEHVRDIPSLATVQGLLIMFIVSCYLGQDKAGVIYRHLGYDMLENLRIEDRINFTSEPQEKAAYCKAEWGIYCYER
jgi:hypothetical protein